MIYKTIDLCAGIGGIRRGFELTGKFENVLSAEIDEYACKTYEHLFGETPKNDLTSEEFKELVSRTEYDILLAGFPSQNNQTTIKFSMRFLLPLGSLLLTQSRYQRWLFYR